ncbi:reverse transcriptase, RNaseH [Metarhizium robertsii ARSEF 23]|uniref:Reverse transcriptase, RNaseH n=1 Tax=Metarhizium robertsii (strain ARSEF 23 / ATCC MYA-3075) TaxID=655844 RepID=A0A0B2XFJ7_METRA|nr:reverse transcriptase, RNaseH [Metarhizium robertsii ARSEF 23]KHO10691.1 reverse transcriptase, RNaseH [Metarhizium robertsii ARSEF 23]
MVETRKRGSSPVDDRQNNPTKKSRTTVKPRKAVKNLGTCSMDKKQIGDSVKAALALSKYALNRTLQMDTAFFRAFFVDNKGLTNPLQITPTEFDDGTPVVVVDVGHHQAGAWC